MSLPLSGSALRRPTGLPLQRASCARPTRAWCATQKPQAAFAAKVRRRTQSAWLQ